MVRSIFLGSVVALAFGQVGVAQTPFTAYHARMNAGGHVQATEYTDINNTAKSITIPRGTAVIVWTINNRCQDSMSGRSSWIRPVIGSAVPEEDTHIFAADTDYRNYTGSWATPTSGGELTVKLQAKCPGDDVVFSVSGFSWTLIVFPESTVPAIGGVGLGIMAVLVLGAGALVLSRRRQARVQHRSDASCIP